MSSYAPQSAAVRVKVKKCEANAPTEWRKFSIDPEITTLEVLYSLLAKAFEISTDFSIKYKAFDPAGNEIYLSVLSDWDLDAAFLRIHNVAIQTATEPCLTLQIDIKPFTEVKDWDSDASQSSGATTTVAAHGPAHGSRVRSGSAISSSSALSPTYAGAGAGASAARELITPLQQSLGVSQKYVQHMQTKLPGLIMNQMEKTFSMVQKAFNLSEETMASLPPRAPLADHEFRLFLDALGQIQRSDELRKVIFFGGIDPSLRRVVWKHILNVYPSGMNGHQRMEYMRRKSEHYYKLRDTWKIAIKQGCVIGELSYVTSMVKKDVLRTDRLHPFYAGSDDNQNIASLFNILTTYALNHPSVSYCQGMSDLASPLLVCMQDEAQAYICFCAIMARVRGNFLLDGIAMTQKFAHLTEALSFYDPEFWDYLKSQQADDLLFCYRWLLLELKREFPFEDALRMLEVQWSSLRYETSADRELCLYEREFVPLAESSSAPTTTSSSLSGSLGAPPISPSYLAVKQRENAYTKVCALRRQSSSASLSSLSSSVCGAAAASKLDSTKRLNQSLDDNMSLHATRRHRHSSSKAHQSLDESKMLMLMESANEGRDAAADAAITIGGASAIALTDIEDNDNDDDDDVFMHNNSSSSTSGHGKCVTPSQAEPFDFHPTNPFKEDAQLYVSKQTSIHSAKVRHTTPAAAAKAFLSSSTSSSLTEEEAAAVTEARAPSPPPLSAKANGGSSTKSILSNYGAVSHMIAKQVAAGSAVAVAAAAAAGAGGVASSSRGHFKELKEKIAATTGRKGLSFDDAAAGGDKAAGGPQVKLVKNFNEFLNFAAVNKNRLADKLATTTANATANLTSAASEAAASASTINVTQPTPAVTHPPPLVQVQAKGGGGGGGIICTSLDDSESSSSVPETTWSCSTAATAIQHLHELSSHSLHLELGSLSSTTAHTPEPTTPTPTRVGQRTHGEGDGDDDGRRSTAALTPDDSQDQEYYPMSTAITRELRLEAENLDRHVFGEVQAVAAASATRATNASEIVYEQLDKDSLDLVEDLKENEIIACPDVSELLVRRRARDAKARSSLEPLQRTHTGHTDHTVGGGERVAVDSNLNLESSLDALKLNPFLDESFLSLVESEVPLPCAITPNLPTSSSLPEVLVPLVTTAPMAVDVAAAPIELATNAADEIAYAKATPPQRRHTALGCNGSGDEFGGVTAAAINTVTPAGVGVGVGCGNTTTVISATTLPPPMEFGGGNPFLMFLCLTLLLQHRNTIMKSAMDYNEIAMHFDKMVRKHDVTRVLNQARSMYIDYLKLQRQQQQQQQAQTQTQPPCNANHSSDINRNNAKFALPTTAPHATATTATTAATTPNATQTQLTTTSTTAATHAAANKL